MTQTHRRPWGAVRMAAMLAAAFALAPAPAAAAADEATAIRRSVEHVLASWRFRDRLTIDGRVGVTEDGGAYRIVLPGLAIAGAQADAGSLDVGDVVIRATPHDDGSYAVTATLPKTMGILDQDGIVRAFVVIGGQRITGLWLPALQTLTRAEAVLDDVWVTEIGGTSRAHMATLAMTADIEERAPGLWDGPSTFRLADLELTAPGEGSLKLAAGKVTTAATGMRLDEQARAVAKIGQSLGDEAGESPPPVEPLVILRLAEKSALVFDSMKTEVALSGLAYAPEKGNQGFALDRAEFAMGIEDLTARLARVRFHYEHDGLALSETGVLGADYVPRHALFDLVADNVPAEDLRDGLFDYAAATAVTGQAAAGGAQLANRMSAAAMDAGTEVGLKALTLEAPDFSLRSQGAFKSDRTAARKVTGWLDTTIRGLDGMVRSLSAATDQAQAAQAVGFATFLRSLGAVETDQTGAKVRRYRIEITPEGRMLLNGQDFATVLGAAMAQQP